MNSLYMLEMPITVHFHHMTHPICERYGPYLYGVIEHFSLYIVGCVGVSRPGI
jgi:hypothetical protein